MCDVKGKALWLLQFIEDSLQEGLMHPHTLADCLEEADCALRILGKHVRQDGMLDASFALSPLNHQRFSDVAGLRTEEERTETVRQCLGFIARTRDLFTRL